MQPYIVKEPAYLIITKLIWICQEKFRCYVGRSFDRVDKVQLGCRMRASTHEDGAYLVDMLSRRRPIAPFCSSVG